MVSNFILGSSSDCRLKILHSLGLFPKDVCSPDIDESVKSREIPKTYVQRMAREKADKVYNEKKGEIIITADTVAACGRRILPKALSDDDVRFCLEILSGKRHRLYTSICLVLPDGKIRQKTVMTVVKFKNLDVEEIEMYIKSCEGIGKAGGYSIQGIAQTFVLFIGGSYFNVVGLPAYEVVSLLKSAGVKQQAVRTS